nr:hypothetical protein [Tanacetum cinerariifolium]
MSALAEHIIIAGAKNHPPMLEKSMYDSWASRIRLFIKGKKHGRMMLDSIDNGPLDYPTVDENRQTRPKKYFELTEAQQLQNDCNVQETNIILHGLLPDVYELINHQEAAKDIWDRVKLIMKGAELSYQERECRLYNLFDKLLMFRNSVELKIELTLEQSQQGVSNDVLQGEDPIECINKAIAFLSPVASRRMDMVRQCAQPKRPRNAAWFKKKLMLAEAQEAGQILDEEQLEFLADLGISKAPNAQQLIPQNLAFQTEDLDAYDSDCDDLSSAKAVLMANLLSCDSNVLSEVPYSDSYPNDINNQDVQEM